jgi:hypothetical protein
MPRMLAALLLFVGTAGPLAGEVVWTVADEGPRTAVVTQILGNDDRTIAFTLAGEAEFDGAAWRPVALNTGALPASNRTLWSTGGRFVATAREGNQLVVFTLQGTAWMRIASVPWPGNPITLGNDRIYLLPDGFNAVMCLPGAACGADEPSRRLASISLVDGTLRQEPLLPACTGRLYSISGRLFLIQTPPACGGPTLPAGKVRTAADPSYPFFRLDGDRWTALEPFGDPVWNLQSTPGALWAFGADGDSDSLRLLNPRVRVFDGTSFSPVIPIPESSTQAYAFPAPLETGGRKFLVSRESFGNLYELKYGAVSKLEPAAPLSAGGAPSAFLCGSRLFSVAEGWISYRLGPTGWIETAGLPASAGGQAYAVGSAARFALRGNRVFRRDAGGWTLLAPPALPGTVSLGAVLGEKPVVWNEGRLFTHDAATDAWKDLEAPEGLKDVLLVSGGDLYVGGGPGTVGRFRNGSWQLLASTTNPPPAEGDIRTLREIGGGVYAFSGVALTSALPGYRVEGSSLVPAFPGLPPLVGVIDAVDGGNRPLLAVSDLSRHDGLQAAVMLAGPAGYETLLTWDDFSWAAGDGPFVGASLASFDGALLTGGLAYDGGRLRGQRSPVVPSRLDPGGRFGFGSVPAAGDGTVRTQLFVPERRVRKVLAAAVDATGFGGTRYRSTLLLANFSATRTAVARVLAGAGSVPVQEVPLGPGVQKRIEDPAPGFLGPLVVDFDGLSGDDEAWAAVRVWSPSDGGTAGTSLIASDPGDLDGATVAIPPIAKEGTRLHLALAAPAAGSGQGATARACRTDPYSADHCLLNQSIPNGAFLQIDVGESFYASPIVVEDLCPSCLGAGSDLAGYLVRNEAGTNDGTVIPLESPAPVLGRRTRFLPAVVAVESAFGLYRTELTLGWRLPYLAGDGTVTVVVTFRADGLSWSFPVTFDSKTVVPIPDAGAWLRAHGVPVDPANVVGTLTFTADRPEGAANLLVTAVVTARGPGASGDYGVSVPVFSQAEWASSEAVVPGLREDASYRSNLAIASPEPDGGPPVTLTVSVRRGSDGAVVGTFPPVQLSPGQRFQLNRLLATVDYSGDAYAVVTRTGGTGRFVAYGVINDNVTGDGTLFPMTRSR